MKNRDLVAPLNPNDSPIIATVVTIGTADLNLLQVLMKR